MKQVLIKAEQVTAFAGGTEVLGEIDWEVRQGENWLVTGRIGAGKSSLAKLLMGKIRIANGTLSFPFLGQQQSFEKRQQNIAYVPFGRRSLLSSATNRTYYQQRYYGSQAEGQPTVREYLRQICSSDEFDQHIIASLKLESLLNQKHIELSSGQTRRLLLAAALLRRPSVLLLDNAHLGLDPAMRIQFNDILDELVTSLGTTIILFGHFDHNPDCITNELVLDHGQIKYSGQLRSIHVRTAVEGDTSFTGTLDPIVHRRIDNEIVRFTNVDLKYGDKSILSRINWTVNKGEKWAVVGSNGSGKSSLMAMIYADHPQAYSNDIAVFGRKRGTGESIWQIKQNIGFTSPEIQSYFDAELSVEQFLSTAFTSSMATEPLSKEQRKFAVHLLDFFDLADLITESLLHLSDGTQRLMFFIRCLLRRPALYIMDEPFQGLDHATKALCRILLDTLLSTEDTLLFITHYPEELPYSVTRSLYLSESSTSLEK